MRLNSLFIALLAGSLVGCPSDPPADDDDTTVADDDDTTVADDDDSSDDDDATAPDDDDTTGSGLDPRDVANFPSFASDRQNDKAGWSVAIVGDVNADGFDDFVIGASAEAMQEAGSDPGQVYLFFGKAEPDWDRDTPLSEADVAWQGSDNDDLGLTVIGPGDWNGDGYDDIVVGAPQFAQGNAFAGRVWIILGRPAGWPVVMTPIDEDSSAIEVLPDEPNGRLGAGLAAVGDINGDGLPDFSAAAPGVDGNRGRVYLYFGRTDPIVALPSTDASVVTLSPDCADCYGSTTGQRLAGLGDVDGDGIDDFAVGAPRARPADGSTPLGRVYLVAGRETWPAHVDLEGGPTLGSMTVLTGGFGNSDLGMGIAGGDLDGDGISELFVGAPHNDDSPFDRGHLYVFQGVEGGLGYTPDLSSAIAVLEGDEELQSVGYTPALGDFDGDGDLDLALGCPESAGLGSPLARSGRLYLLNEPPGSWVGTDPGDNALATWLGREYPQWVGASVSVGGDINGDGYDDILVGAPEASSIVDRGGQTYLILGGEEGDLGN